MKGTVDAVIWAPGLGQLPASGTMPMTGMMAIRRGRYRVKFDIAERDEVSVRVIRSQKQHRRKAAMT